MARYVHHGKYSMKDAPLFSPDSTLRDVPEHFHGITPLEFYTRDVKAQCDEWLKTLEGLKRGVVAKSLPEKFVCFWTQQAKEPLIEKMHAHGPRDNYGWKSL